MNDREKIKELEAEIHSISAEYIQLYKEKNAMERKFRDQLCVMAERCGCAEAQRDMALKKNEHPRN